MNGKNHPPPAATAPAQAPEAEAAYLAYLACFNRQQFFEAHDALEPLWLAQRHHPNGPLYKGLIQLAGACVHLQRGRPQPAAALFKLAAANLARFPAAVGAMDVEAALATARDWLARLEAAAGTVNPFDPTRPPALHHRRQ